MPAIRRGSVRNRLRVRFSRVSRERSSSLETHELPEADGPRRAEPEPAGDHEMEHEDQRSFELERDPLADVTHAVERTPFDLSEGWIIRAE